jgi:hypothetical protein
MNIKNGAARPTTVRVLSALKSSVAVRGPTRNSPPDHDDATECHVTDREGVGLRGRVKICSTERDYVYPDHHWVMYTNDTFSPQGHLLERRHRNPEGSHWSIICRYDEQGRILEKEQIGEEPEARQLFSYRYDPFDRLNRVILHSAQESERVFESVQYAADGTKTKTSYPTPLDDTKRRTTGVCAESMLHVSIDAVVIMTVLDASDRAIRKVLYDADERVIRRIAFRCDGRGLLLEEGELVGGSIRDDFRNVYDTMPRGARLRPISGGATLAAAGHNPRLPDMILRLRWRIVNQKRKRSANEKA